MKDIQHAANKSDTEKTRLIDHLCQHQEIVQNECAFYQDSCAEVKKQIPKDRQPRRYDYCSFQGQNHIYFDFVQQTHFPCDQAPCALKLLGSVEFLVLTMNLSITSSTFLLTRPTTRVKARIKHQLGPKSKYQLGKHDFSQKDIHKEKPQFIDLYFLHDGLFV